jgi:hypothetical protein
MIPGCEVSRLVDVVTAGLRHRRGEDLKRASTALLGLRDRAAGRIPHRRPHSCGMDSSLHEYKLRQR